MASQSNVVPFGRGSASADESARKFWYRETLKATSPPGTQELSEGEARQFAGDLFTALAKASPELEDGKAGDVHAPGLDQIYEKQPAQRGQGKGQKRKRHREAWDRPWRHDTPFIVAVGVVPRAQTHPRSNAPPTWRIAVRVQSPRPLQKTLCDAIRTDFENWCPKNPNLVSVRFTSPVHLMQADRTWKGAGGPRFAVGAPAGIADGGVGALTLLLQHQGQTYALMSGHVVSHGGAGHVGASVYCPPQYEPAYELGTIDELHVLPRWELLSRPGARAGRTPDYALVRVLDQAQPLLGRARSFGPGLRHSGQFATPLAEGEAVAKVAARSVLCEGTVRAVGVLTAVQDAISSTICYANNMVEIELINDSEILPGDSGSLVYRCDGAVPAAMMLAGARRGSLSNPPGKQVQICYAMPFSELDLPPDMVVV